MESETGAPARPGEWRSGWPVVAAAMIGIGTGPGLFQNVSSLFIDGMTTSFGWSRGELATAAGLGLLGALAVPFLGRLADRAGARLVIIAAMLTLGIAYAGFAAQTGGLYQYQALVFLLSLTVAGTSAVVYGKLISARFERHRGIALGVATSGIAIASLALSPVIAWVVSSYGWRAGFATLGALVVFVALPLVLFLLRGAATAPTRPGPGNPNATVPVAGMTGAEARRDSRFWRLGLSAALVNVASVGLVTALVPFGQDRGLTLEQAALLVTAFAASQIVGRLLMGALVDRFRPQLMAAGFAGLSALAFIGLQMPEPGLPLLLLLVFAAGLMNGAEHDLLPFLTARLFGLRAYGESYGLLLAIALAGTATGVVTFGRLHDATGDYTAALFLAAGALALSALLFLTLRERPLPLVQAAAEPA